MQELAPCLKPVAGYHRAGPSTTLDKVNQESVKLYLYDTRNLILCQ